jgi:hypothetical protein
MEYGAGGRDGRRTADQRRQKAKTRDSDMPFLTEPTPSDEHSQGSNQTIHLSNVVIFYTSYQHPTLTLYQLPLYILESTAP